MGYNREIYDEVQQKLYKMRVEAWEELERKKQFFFKRFPEAGEIEKRLAGTAIESARAVLKGSDAQKELELLREHNFFLRKRLTEILKSVDLPSDYLEVNYHCKKCNDEGFIDGMMCECMKDLMKKAGYNRLNSMSPLELSSFETFSLDYYPDYDERHGGESPRKRMRSVLKLCRNYANRFNGKSPSLLMEDSTGLGKTHLSLAIAREVIEKGYGVIYISAPNMVTQLEKDKFQNHGKNSEESERHFIDCDLLIVDDLGTEYITAFSSSAIYNIINSRIMMMKPTIMNTNLTTKELEENYSQRMISRIIGNSSRLKFLGSDIRQIRMRELEKRIFTKDEMSIK